MVLRVCPLISALQRTPNLIKLSSPVAEEKIGVEAAKRCAWWRTEYREARQVEESIKAGTYNPEPPPIYTENGRLNLGYFHDCDEGFI